VLTHIEKTQNIDLSVLKSDAKRIAKTNLSMFGHGTIEGAPRINPKHLPVFACAVSANGGDLVIRPVEHLRVVAAAQPFLSGSSSKTINMPANSTIQDIS